MFNVKRADPSVVELGPFDETEFADQQSFTAFIYSHIQAARIAGVPLMGRAFVAFDLATLIYAYDEIGGLYMDETTISKALVEPNNNEMSICVHRDVTSMTILIA